MLRLETAFIAVVQLEVRHRPQAGLIANDDSFLARPLARRQPTAFDDVFDAHRLVVDGSNHQGADVANAAFLCAAKDSAAFVGSVIPSTLRTGSSPPPNKPTLRTVSATSPCVT